MEKKGFEFTFFKNKFILFIMKKIVEIIVFQRTIAETSIKRLDVLPTLLNFHVAQCGYFLEGKIFVRLINMQLIHKNDKCFLKYVRYFNLRIQR
jgi:hypothetical protein